MGEWTVAFQGAASVDVEADSPREAKQKAEAKLNRGGFDVFQVEASDAEQAKEIHWNEDDTVTYTRGVEGERDGE